MKNNDNNKIVKFIIISIIIALVLFLSENSRAQSNMSVGVSFDIMIPVAVFANHYSTGFGGTGEFDYAISQKSSITGKIGYLTWSEKNLLSGLSSSYNGVPLFVGIKYYLQSLPKEIPFHLYGHLEVGFLFGSVSGSGNNISGGTTGATDWCFVPSGGMEIPVVTNGAIDASIRYLYIFKKSSAGIRTVIRSVSNETLML